MEDHYYTFSRFLISRVLSVTKVTYADSLKISLALKKEMVDAGRLDITQAEMEELLFTIMRTNVGHIDSIYVSKKANIYAGGSSSQADEDHVVFTIMNMHVFGTSSALVLVKDPWYYFFLHKKVQAGMIS